jgi:hypothetical protein
VNKLLTTIPEDNPALIDLFARHDAASADLREFLTRQPNLPKFVRVDFAKGERIGRVMTWPRNPNPRSCFPQQSAAVRVEPGQPGKPGRAVLDRFATDARFKLWESEGLVMVAIDGKWGFADAVTGRIVIEPKFDRAENFSEGLAVVIVDGNYGYADKAGSFVVKPRFQWGYAFAGGRAAVKEGGKFGLIDAKGSWVKEPTYEMIDPSGSGWMATTFDGQEGMLDDRGEIISPKKQTP